MKKGTFEIRRHNKQNEIVKGYIYEDVGIHCVRKGNWNITDLATGLSCNRFPYKTKAGAERAIFEARATRDKIKTEPRLMLLQLPLWI